LTTELRPANGHERLCLPPQDGRTMTAMRKALQRMFAAHLMLPNV
jgi:hypothetical protein